MKSRSDKLAKLKEDKLSTSNQRKVDDIEFVSRVAKDLKETIAELKAVLGVGVDVNASELIEEIKNIQSLAPEIKKLEKVIEEIHIPEIPPIPEDIELKGIDDLKEAIGTYTEAVKGMPKVPESITLEDIDMLLVNLTMLDAAVRELNIPEEISLTGTEGIEKAIKNIKVPETKVSYIDDKNTKEIINGIKKSHKEFSNEVNGVLKKLITVVKTLEKNVYKGDQTVGDYIPVRRVRHVGSRLIFDDDAWTGSSSGGGTSFATVTSNTTGGQAVPVVNPDGSNVSSGGSSSGTEYVEDAVSPANPSAGALSLRRRDSLAAETTTDGDWVTANATNKGEQYVKHVDAIDTELPTAVALSDTLSNPTTPLVGSATLGWQATSSLWGRVHAHKFTADGVVPADHLALVVGGPILFYNGTTFDRARGDITNGLDVDVTRSALPSGAATATKQDTISNSISDQLDQYKINDIEKGVTYNYYGFTDKAETWYILRETIAGTEYRYATVTNNTAIDYDTAITGAWATRASLVYGYFHGAF